MIFAGMMALGSLFDTAFGWPAALQQRIKHPVQWIGAAISVVERRWNKGSAARRRSMGLLCVISLLALTVLPALVVQTALPAGWVGIVLGGVIAWPFIALRSMYEHVAAVLAPLAAGDLKGARRAVAAIVGRDPAVLDHEGVARAALESLAENTSDGIVAPLFWGALLGLPGLIGYKTINTMDSMIGHRTARYEDFGRSAARLDDLVNLIPARLTGALFALAGWSATALRIMWRDARRHRSPNAGWPEAAMAGALGLRLSGPRLYGEKMAQEPWVNEGAPDPQPQDLKRGLALYWRAMFLCIASLIGLAMI